MGKDETQREDEEADHRCFACLCSSLQSEELEKTILCGLVSATCCLVRVQVSIGLSMHHMWSLVYGWVESQISAIVTVYWWADWDWNWLSWHPVMTSTNLNIYFEFLLAYSHWQIVLVVIGLWYINMFYLGFYCLKIFTDYRNIWLITQ